MQRGKFNTIVDAAWGSSGKGATAARLCDIHRPSDLSASNFPNAGHTVVMERGTGILTVEKKTFIFKSLPSGAALHWRDNTYQPRLWIGPNSGYWPQQMVNEMSLVGAEWGLRMLRIHPRAVVMHQRHCDAEAPGGVQSTEHISSTMSGSGAAFAEKAMRKPEVELARDRASFTHDFQGRLALSQTMVLHEVSQGYALSINHGTHYPHCTFRDCTPQQAYADFMVRPEQVGDVYLNIRSFPIRVGNNFRDGEQTGYSGNFYPDQRELTWQEVAVLAEMPTLEAAELAERERTTVTKKVRRVATQSLQLCAEAARFCGATKLVYNFPQYVHWSAHRVRGGKEKFITLHEKVRRAVNDLEEACNLPVVLIGTGAHHDDYIFLE